MGVSAGRITLDDGESMGVSVQRSGKALDDDGDLLDYGDQGGGGLLGEEYQQAIEKIRIIEQDRQNLAHQRHSRLHARQEDGSLLSGAMDTVEGAVDTVVSKVSNTLEVASNGPIASSTPIVPTDSSTLSIVLPSGLGASSASVPTDIISNVPIGTSLQTLLSSTPPPSPAETSAGMSIPPVTTTSSSVSSKVTTQPPSQNTGSTNTGPYTTITSYWTSQTLRNNGTTLSNTRATTTSSSSFTSTATTVTLDGTVIVFTYPTDIVDLESSSNTSNSTTRSSTSSVSSSSSSSSSNSTTTSTISSESLATSLWSSATDVAGGGGGGYVAPTGNTDVATAPTSTSTSASSTDSSPPVSPGLLGGVLGGVAGLAFVLVAILYMVRRHRRELTARQLDEAGYGGPLGGSGADQMTQRSSLAPFALAGGFFARGSHQSRVSQSSEAPTVPSSEVGFYKVSGRKLPPVLGGPRPGYDSTRSAGGSSLYPDDDGVTVASTPSVAGPSRYSSMTAASTSPTSSTAPMTFAISPISGPHPSHIGSTMAPPPPRIQEEAAESDTESTHKLPRPPPFPRQLSAISVGSVGKDGVGRSLPSHDGSRASRFTEDIV